MGIVSPQSFARCEQVRMGREEGCAAGEISDALFVMGDDYELEIGLGLA